MLLHRIHPVFAAGLATLCLTAMMAATDASAADTPVRTLSHVRHSDISFAAESISHRRYGSSHGFHSYSGYHPRYYGSSITLSFGSPYRSYYSYRPRSYGYYSYGLGHYGYSRYGLYRPAYYGYSYYRPRYYGYSFYAPRYYTYGAVVPQYYSFYRPGVVVYRAYPDYHAAELPACGTCGAYGYGVYGYGSSPYSY